MSESAVELPIQQEHVQLLDGGAEAFPRMLSAIDAARERVRLQIYTFAWDDVGRRFVRALSQAARRGVQVHVTMDGWGSLLSGSTVARALRAEGCRVHIYHPVSALLLGGLRRNHRKILLVDDRVAFVGGINIGQEYETRGEEQGWADLAVEVTGPAATALGQRLRGRRLQTTAPAAGAASSVRIFLSGLGGGRRLRSRYFRAFSAAKRSIVLAHAYFLPDLRLARSLRLAARRGVEVRLLLAGRSDVPFARMATVRLYRGFLRAGVRIFEWHRSVLHAKAALVDSSPGSSSGSSSGEARFLVGSFNLDPLSLANLEALVEITSPDTTAGAARWLEKKLAESREVTLADLPHHWWQRWVGEVLGLFVARATEFMARIIAFRRPAPFGEASATGQVPRLGVRRRRQLLKEGRREAKVAQDEAQPRDPRSGTGA